MNLNRQLAPGKTNLKRKFALGKKNLKGWYALGIMIFTRTAGPGRQEFNVAGLALRRLTCGLCPPRAAVYLLLWLPAVQRLRVFLLARDRRWPAQRPGGISENAESPIGRGWRHGCLFRSGARVVSCSRLAGQRPRRNVILVLHLHGPRTAAGRQQPDGAACGSRSCPTVAPAAWRQQVQRLHGAKTCASPGGARSLAFLRAVAAGRRHLRQLERRRSGTGGLEAPGAAAVRRQDLR